MNKESHVSNVTDQESGSASDQGGSNPFALYERVARQESGYREGMANYVRGIITSLQAEELLPSAPMSESDRSILVETLIVALDRATCPDDEDSKRGWILDSARAIYSAGK